MAIGDKVAGQSPARQYSSQRPDPQAFGAGVVNALGNLANSTENAADTFLKLQGRLETRRDKSEDFQTERKYIEFIGEQNRRQAERIRGTTESADGITNFTQEELATAKNEFLQTVPERLREEYATKITTFEQNTVTSAFNFEYTAGNEKFVKDINVSLNSEASEVLLGNKSADEARANVETLIERSDLDEPSKRDLRTQAESFLLKAEYQKEVEYAVDFQGAVTPKTEGDVVAAGLLPHERGILNAISSPESSDRYDVMYSGKKITDFSDHPREYITITSGPNKGKKSSAAGKYQFLASTWDATVREYNSLNPHKPVKDFSPEAQDRVALFYARKIYNRQLSAGEASFDQVLMSGNRDLIISMKNALTDDKGGWEGFRHMSDNAFANIIMGSKGIRGGGTGSPGAPDIWENPKYAGLSFEDKNRLSQYGAKAVAARDVDAAQLAKAQQDATTEQAMMNAIQGKYVLADMANLIKDGTLNDSAAVTKWQGLVEGANKNADEIARVGGILNSGGQLYTTDNKGLNLFLGDAGKEAVRNLDADYAQQTLLPVANRAGFFPSEYAEQLNSMVQSSNVQAREYATGILAAAASADPRILDRSPKLTEDVKRQVLLADRLRTLYTPDEVAERLRAANDPQQAQALEMFRKEGEKIFQDNYTADDLVDSFDTSALSFGPKAPMTVGQAAVFKQDYQTAFVEGYAISQDETTAKEYADKMMQRTWSSTAIGGAKRLSKYPPEVYYPTLNQSHEWLDSQVREEFGFGSDTQFQLIPDAQTQAEGKRYNSVEDKTGLNNASYQIAFLNEQGLPEMVLDEDGMPVRFAGGITDDMKRQVEDSAQLQNARHVELSLLETRDLDGNLTPENERLLEVARGNAEEIVSRNPNAGQVIPKANRKEIEDRIALLKEKLGPNPKSDFAGSFNDRMMKEIEALEKKLENN